MYNVYIQFLFRLNNFVAMYFKAAALTMTYDQMHLT